METSMRVSRSAIPAVATIGLCLFPAGSWAEGVFGKIMATGASAWGDFNNDYWPDMADGGSAHAAASLPFSLKAYKQCNRQEAPSLCVVGLPIKRSTHAEMKEKRNEEPRSYC